MKDLWAWERCKNRIRHLKGRLGFSDNSALRFLGLSLNLKDGSVYDDLTNYLLNKNDQYLSKIYCILYSYSEAEATTETGKLVTSKQLQGGRYCNIMISRAKSIIIDLFGKRSKMLVECAKLLGG